MSVADVNCATISTGKMNSNREPITPTTDLTKWRLHCEKGRQTWEYDEADRCARGPNFIEKHALGLNMVGCYPNVVVERLVTVDQAVTFKRNHNVTHPVRNVTVQLLCFMMVSTLISG